MENSFYVLLAVLIPLCILVFILTEYDILNPVCIVTSLMTCSVFLATTKIERWHLYMSVDASLLIISSLLCFIFGGIWADWQIKKNIQGIPAIKEKCVYSISRTKLILMCLIVLCLGYFQYGEFYGASVTLGNMSGPFDFSSMIKVIRPSIERETFKFSRWYSYRHFIAQMMVFCSTFVLLMRVISHSGRIVLSQSIEYLFPVLAYIPFVLCNTGRGLHLEFILFILLTGAAIYQIRSNFSVESKIEVIKACVVCGLLFFTIFLALGLLSGKVRIGGRSAYEILVHYVGLSMPAFSVFLERVQMETPYIGNTTLHGIYNNLNRLGAGLPPVKSFLTFVYFNDISTNVYTMMARYIKDYGFVGMHVIMSFLGIFYVAFYDYLRLVSTKFDFMPYYGILPMTLFFATNDDRFFSRVLNTSTFYKFILLYLIFKVFVTKNKNA